MTQTTSGTGPSERASAADVFASIKGSHDTMSVSRSYGDPFDVDGLTVIPVARVSGGGGGGGGDGEDTSGSSGGGFGTGFGMRVNPLGVYEVRGDHLEWKPSIDVNRLARGGQVLAGIVVVCVTLVMLVRSK